MIFDIAGVTKRFGGVTAVSGSSLLLPDEPAASTVHEILRRSGLVRERKNKRGAILTRGGWQT
ncbi:MAG: hypothetical protein NTY46_07365 [Candidatus Sumerlaeota bacterium]|nr:hypothetical protein [Candidatus Sumerlaeota bacterium]